jgi:hypothetical protein
MLSIKAQTKKAKSLYLNKEEDDREENKSSNPHQEIAVGHAHAHGIQKTKVHGPIALDVRLHQGQGRINGQVLPNYMHRYVYLVIHTYM